MTSGPVCLFVNAGSRSGESDYEEAVRAFSDRGVPLAHHKRYDEPLLLLADLRERLGPDALLVVGGGDGTLSAAANHIVPGGGTLGVLPLGTGNQFARDLGIAAEVKPAVDAIVDGKTVQVDVGSLNGRLFINVATLGLTHEIATRLDAGLKRRLGKFAYGFAVRDALRAVRPFRISVDTDEGRVDASVIMAVVGSGRYHAGPFPLSPTASLTSGKLHVYFLEDASRATLLKFALLLPFGLQGSFGSAASFAATRGLISADPKQPVVTDGEELMCTPFRFAAHPGALSVRVPESFEP